MSELFLLYSLGWLNLRTGTFTVVGYLLYRFSQSRSDADLSQLPGLRIVLLRPCDGRHSSLADFLLGPAPSATDVPSKEPPLQSSKRTIVLNMGEITIIDTPALPGVTLDHRSRVREELHQDLDRITQATMELFGDDVADYIIPVITHKHNLSARKIEHLRRSQQGLCQQRLEVVNISSERSVDDQNTSRIGLLMRVAELKKMKGSFVHELQRREERVREELLTDMATALAAKLGHVY
ncbi:hypothetical protein WMY93_000081 [Mugilogobius chulae]|uniref:Uncharacterized protein n=1 Tax=Mugilogobius chulae TaxID=88201 RepID=A0AAW0PZV8_9GOBI